MPVSTIDAVMNADVRRTPTSEPIALIHIQSPQPLVDDMTRAYRFTISSGGRNMWQDWFDNNPVFVACEDGSSFEVQIAAFPTNSKTDYGYLKLVRQL